MYLKCNTQKLTNLIEMYRVAGQIKVHTDLACISVHDVLYINGHDCARCAYKTQICVDIEG